MRACMSARAARKHENEQLQLQKFNENVLQMADNGTELQDLKQISRAMETCAVWPSAVTMNRPQL